MQDCMIDFNGLNRTVFLLKSMMQTNELRKMWIPVYAKCFRKPQSLKLVAA